MQVCGDDAVRVGAGVDGVIVVVVLGIRIPWAAAHSRANASSRVLHAAATTVIRASYS
jgi:hypothetical protein